MFEKTLSSVNATVSSNLEITGSGSWYIVKCLALSKSLLWLQFLNVKSGKHISAFLYNLQLLYSNTPKVTKTHFKLTLARAGNLWVHLNVKANRKWKLALSPGLAVSSLCTAALCTESSLQAGSGLPLMVARQLPAAPDKHTVFDREGQFAEPAPAKVLGLLVRWMKMLVVTPGLCAYFWI